MNLSHLDQRVDLYEGEAQALLGAVQRYLYQIAQGCTQRPMPLEQILRLKPLGRICQRLNRLLPGPWTKRMRGRPVAKARALRLEVDEMLVLVSLYRAGELQPLLESHELALQVSLGQVHQRAQNLSTLFQV